MTLNEAVKLAKEKGIKFKRPSWESAIYFDEDTKGLYWDSSDEDVTLTPSRAMATDYEVVEEDAGSDSLYAYYDEAKGRWRSTASPKKLSASGVQVARFVRQG